MRLAALTAGLDATADPFGGSIHSVFARACNIMLDQERLLTLVAREVGAVPRGFQLATAPGFGFSGRVRPGSRVSCRAGILRIAKTDLSIDLRTARPWRGMASGSGLDIARPAAQRAWQAAWAALEAHRGAASFAESAATPIAALVDAAAALDVDKAAMAVVELVGRGDGLTPAGDDLLAGCLAGLWRAVCRRPERQAFVARLADAARRAAVRTNVISRSYLEAAAEGEVAEPLALLAAHIGDGDAARTSMAVRAALSIGASSGAVGTLGLLLAVRAWRGDRA